MGKDKTQGIFQVSLELLKSSFLYRKEVIDMGLTIKEYPAIKVDSPLKDKGLFAAFWAADNGLCVCSNNPVHQIYFDKVINDKLIPKIDSGKIKPIELV